MRMQGQFETTEIKKKKKKKEEQQQAVLDILDHENKDVFAVLPAGFDKSFIYQSYSVAKTVIDAVALLRHL